MAKKASLTKGNLPDLSKIKKKDDDNTDYVYEKKPEDSINVTASNPSGQPKQ